MAAKNQTTVIVSEQYFVRTPQPLAYIGVRQRQNAQDPNYLPLGQNAINTRHDCQQIANSGVPLNNTVATSVTHSTSSGITPSSTVLSSRKNEEHSASQTLNNLSLASVPEHRVNSRNMFDQQTSLQITSADLLGSFRQDFRNQQQQSLSLQGQHQNNILSNTVVPGWQQLTVGSPSLYFSSDDNTENISVHPKLDPTLMTARPLNHLNSPRGASGGQQSSLGSNGPSLKSFISDNCLVKKLPWRIIRYVASTLQCRYPSASWKDLVEMYGWDYDRTYLFENRSHQEGIFFSLLHEPEFQNYSLDQLRQNLYDLPRRDILSDLNKMILEHNASTAGGATSFSQNNMY